MTQFNQPKRQQIIDAYRNGTDEQKKVLVELFGEIEPKNVMERVKTFDDACCELGDNHVFVKDYRALCAANINIPAYELAYYKLRIICAALNEGWKPDYTDDNQLKYYPWFYACDEVYKNSHPEYIYHDLCGVNSGSRCNTVCVYSHASHSYSRAFTGYRLCLKTRELALYAGSQFFDIYADYTIK